MSSWLAVALLAGIVCFSTIVLVYCFLYSKYKERYLLLWAWAWIFHATRNAIILLNVEFGPMQGLLIVEQLLVVGTSAMLVWGAATYYGIRAGKRFSWPAMAAASWVPMAVLFDVPKPWFYIPTYFYFGLAQVASGVLVLRKSSREGVGGWVAGGALVLWGLHHLDYPFLRPVAWFAPWGFLIGAVLGLLTAIGIILAYFERVQKDLARSEERFRSLFAGHDAPFVIVEPVSGDIVEANAAASRYYGYTLEEMRSMSISQINTLPPEQVARMRREAREKRRSRFEFEHRLKSGELRAVEAYSSPVNVGGRDLLFSIIHDISDRVVAEGRLRQANETFAAVFDGVPAEVSVTDLSTHEILFANKAKQERHGGDCVGQICFKAFAGRSEPCRNCSMKHFANGNGSGVGELVYENIDAQDGSCRICHERAVRWMDGRPARFQIAVDITDRKNVERAMAASLEEKEVLLREVHHRVKNNLQIISSLLSLQEEHAGDQAARESLAESRSRIVSMALIHEEIYRSGSFKEVDVESYLRRILPSLVSCHATGGGVALEIDARDAALSLEQAVPFGLLVNELATNAIKHAFDGRERGTLSVVVRQDGRVVFLEVRDDGKGMPPGVDPACGDTLGLQLVRALSGQLHGEMELVSDGGVRFNLRFPKADSRFVTD